MVVFKGSLKNGFFVEAGADDFMTDSNTLYFETRKNWTGLLVEPNPIIYPKGYKYYLSYQENKNYLY